MNVQSRGFYLLALLVACPGCSSLGLTLWPTQLPILSKAKEFAEKSPLPSGLDHELDKQVVTDYFIEPGDRILIEPIELDSDFQSSGDQEVMVDGSVDLGRFGRIRVSGMTVEAIEAAVSNQIATITGEREIVNVQLIETNASQIYVLGAVGSPGAYDLDGNETVLDAILLAGGLTSKASPCDVLMVRPTDPCDRRVVQRICFRQITQLGDVTTNYQLQPGDRVVVGERTLCEELAFWTQSTGCPCCDRSKTVQCDPATENYTNRFVRWPLPFTLPSKQRETQEQAGDDVESGSQAGDRFDAETESVGDSAESRDSSDVEEKSLKSQDSEFFLPPAKPPTPSETGALDALGLGNLRATSRFGLSPVQAANQIRLQ